MKKQTSISIGLIVAGCWLASGTAWAEQPIEPPQSGPQTGGIPQCQADLAECTINLTETETALQVCKEALEACQATEGQAFPATGQTSCWDSAGTLLDTCEGTGHDGDIQAGAPIDAESSYTVTDETIIDNNTKLEWMKQDDNDSLGTGTIFCDPGSYPDNLDKDCLFTWDEAFTFVTSLNAANHAGGGWRVPNVKEVQSIVNYENFGPAVSVEFNTGCVESCVVANCSCTAAANYWSSTSIAFKPSFAWYVDFNIGGVFNGGKNGGVRVRAVRGGL